MRPLVRFWLPCSTAVAGLMLVGITSLDAHKAITSKYSYNDDVFPILREKCGSCHTDGGPAPTG